MIVKMLCLPPQVTAANAGDLKREIDELLGTEPCILGLDLHDVAYMDSAGLSILVFAFKRTRELGGSVRIHQPQAAILQLFRATHMDQVFEIVDTPPEVAPTS